ncbi:MAG: SDR family NAD(P)-dependent oxidoreductase [Vicinamibacterales bacterium]
MQLNGRVVLVSGGASGLGAATAARIVAGGGHAVILDIDTAAAERTMAALGAGATFVRGDVTREEDVAAGVAAAVARGPLAGAVCTAGVVAAERVLAREGVQPLAHFARTIAINLTGTFNVVRLAAAALAAATPDARGERGVLVMTASVAAFEGQIGQAAYAASKGGIVALTLPLAREFARLGIRVMTIAPGTFDTPLLAGLPDAARESLARQVPFPPRLGRPDEYAALVAHIFENQMLNGEVVRLDGAIRMAPR